MIDKLRAAFPTHTFVQSSVPLCWIVDFKDINGGGVELIDLQPVPKGVTINNPSAIPFIFLGFKDNAFVPIAGQGARQCEGVLFPQAGNPNDWILFIETKYVDNIENAFRASRQYPWNMIDQIIKTVDLFRKQGYIEANRRVWAIVSFPTLIEDFAAFFFSGQKSIEDILFEHKIVIKATNSADILTPKRIRLN